jgi:hypothetical protein
VVSSQLAIAKLHPKLKMSSKEALNDFNKNILEHTK